jgi:hypothetical protein
MTQFTKQLQILRGLLAVASTLFFAGQAQAALLINVDTAGCNTNVAINNAIGQSFRVANVTQLDTIEFWIKPELYYNTSYAMEVYAGEGTGGTRLATSPTISMGSQSGGAATGWYAFSFAGLGVNLAANQPYTLRLVRLSTYSGAFSMCGNVYGNGIQYWLGYHADSPYDASFRLHGTESAPPPPPPPPPPPASEAVISIDTAGCNTNVAINNAVGQSFRVSAPTALDKIEVWIKPELYYNTSYAMELFAGEGGGTHLGTTPAVSMGSQSAGVPSGFRAFSFAGMNITLQPNQPYTFRMVRLSQYSGAFSMCGNVYPNGIQYWLGTYPDSPYDVAFKLYRNNSLALESLSWQAAGPGTRTITPDSSAVDAMSFEYFLNGSAVWSQQSWTFSATSPRTMTLNFDWNYSGFHAWYMVYANAVAFADGPSGRTVVPLYTRNYGDGWNVSGTASLPLTAGYAFGVIIDGRNYDSDARLIGTMKLTSKP